MEKVFLDSNVIIDILGRKQYDWNNIIFPGNTYYISALTLHILFYVLKENVPNKKISNVMQFACIVQITENSALNAMSGPTNDYEDNIQLHCATEVDCSVFLTGDKKLKKIKFFGKAKIADPLKNDWR